MLLLFLLLLMTRLVSIIIRRLIYTCWRSLVLGCCISVTDCVYRWVKWTTLVKYWLHSMTTRALVTCYHTVKVASWSLTTWMIAFYCSAVSWNLTTCSSTAPTLKSNCVIRYDCVTGTMKMNSCHNSTLYTAHRDRQRLRASRYSV